MMELYRKLGSMYNVYGNLSVREVILYVKGK